MKKIKNMLLMSLLTICAVAIVGIDKVYAVPFQLGGTINLVCEPDTITAGEGTDCYLVGRPNPTNGDAVHGYVTYAYTTEFLELNGATVNQNIPNTGAHFMEASSATGGLTATGNMPTGMNGIVCNYDSAIEGGLDFGCAIFYTIKGAAAAFTPTSITTGNDKNTVPNGDTTYGVIGSYQVSLSAAAEGESCGELCVKAWVIPGESDYPHTESCQADGKTATGGSCTDVTTSQTGADYICSEVHYRGGVNPETGTFASYALLVAGALIAIAAITLAKKNTKLYRV
jgi:hypothetical protein